jgi:uncharacterized protein YabN with tetrapyrrole methylase and pyrophosphatase domain
MIDVDPEHALRNASIRFAERFRLVEQQARIDEVELSSLDQSDLGRRWSQAKDARAAVARNDG